jgi:hypothetical protein
VKLMSVRNPHDTTKFCFRRINYAGKRASPRNLRVVNVRHYPDRAGGRFMIYDGFESLVKV